MRSDSSADTRNHTRKLEYIILIGQTYRAHVSEMGYFIFKNVSLFMYYIVILFNNNNNNSKGHFKADFVEYSSILLLKLFYFILFFYITDTQPHRTQSNILKEYFRRCDIYKYITVTNISIHTEDQLFTFMSILRPNINKQP